MARAILKINEESAVWWEDHKDLFRKNLLKTTFPEGSWGKDVVKEILNIIDDMEVRKKDNHEKERVEL